MQQNNLQSNIAEYTPKQYDVINNADARWNILVGAVRSGKTYVNNYMVIKRLMGTPGQPRALIGKTMNTIARNVVEPMQERFGKENVSDIHGWNRKVDIFGVPFYIISAVNRRSVKKLKGISLQYAYGDELTTWPEEFWEMLKSRLDKPGARFDGSTNPEGPNHWFKTGVLDREDELDIYHKHFVLEDNTFLDPEFVKQLKLEYSGVWHARYIEGRWVKAEGLVYDMFDEDQHLVSELPKMKRYWVGIDYGTANPTHYNLLGRGKDNKLYLIDEWRHSGAESGRSKTGVQYSKALQDWLKDQKDRFPGFVPQYIFVDPSEKEFITQIDRDVKYRVKRADNTVLDGIRRVAKLFGTDNFKIHEKCESTISELHSYAWSDKAQKKGEDEPLKENDHSMDGIRYVVNSIGTQYRGILRSD